MAPLSPTASSLKPYLEEAGTPFPWAYQPHTLLGMFAGLSLMWYTAFLLPASPDPLAHARRGVALASLMFLVYCSINLRDSLLLRPHPILWRVIHGAGILYVAGLSFLLAFPVADARGFLRVFWPELTGERPPHNDALYAADCRLYTPGDAGGAFARVWECIDIFVVAHTLGWFGKALLLRDWRLAWLLSVLWELIEITFQRILPNFAGARVAVGGRGLACTGLLHPRTSRSLSSVSRGYLHKRTLSTPSHPTPLRVLVGPLHPRRGPGQWLGSRSWHAVRALAKPASL